MKKSIFILLGIILLSNFILAREVRILTTEEAPTNYTYAGEFTGTSVEIVNEIKKRIGETADIEVYPWARSYNIAKTTPNVVIFTAGKTKEREELGFNFVGPIFTRKYILYKKKGKLINVNNLNDLLTADITVGSVRGDWRSDYFEREGVKVAEATNHIQNINKLMANRIDLLALSDIEAPAILKEAGFSMSDIEIAYVFREGSSYMMLSKGTPSSVVSKWENALMEIYQTNFFDDLVIKWSDILEMSLGYSNKKGVYIKE